MSKKIEDSILIIDQRNTFESYGIKEGILYRHYKGNFYVIKALSFNEKLEPLVTYKSIDTCLVWTRLLSDFVELINVNGVNKCRFERVNSDSLCSEDR